MLLRGGQACTAFEVTKFSSCLLIENDSKQHWKQHTRITELISEGGDCGKTAFCVEWGLHCMLMNTEVPWK